MDGTKPPANVGLDSDERGVYFYLNNKFILMGIFCFVGIILFTIFLMLITLLSFIFKFFITMGIYIVGLILELIIIGMCFIILSGIQLFIHSFKQLINKSNKGVSNMVKYIPSKIIIKAREKVIKDKKRELTKP